MRPLTGLVAVVTAGLTLFVLGALVRLSVATDQPSIAVTTAFLLAVVLAVLGLGRRLGGRSRTAYW